MFARIISPKKFWGSDITTKHSHTLQCACKSIINLTQCDSEEKAFDVLCGICMWKAIFSVDKKKPGSRLRLGYPLMWQSNSLLSNIRILRHIWKWSLKSFACVQHRAQVCSILTSLLHVLCTEAITFVHVHKLRSYACRLTFHASMRCTIHIPQLHGQDMHGITCTHKHTHRQVTR